MTTKRKTSCGNEMQAGRTTKRKPQKAFINVLVRTSTRRALTRLKDTMDLPSQGAVIDHLVAHNLKPARPD